MQFQCLTCPRHAWAWHAPPDSLGDTSLRREPNRSHRASARASSWCTESHSYGAPFSFIDDLSEVPSPFREGPFLLSISVQDLPQTNGPLKDMVTWVHGGAFAENNDGSICGSLSRHDNGLLKNQRAVPAGISGWLT